MTWAVALVQPNMERCAAENLLAQEFDCYFPKFKETVVRRGRRIARVRPLFGRYFFICFIERWRAITGTRGVASLLMRGERPALVGDAVVAEIRSREVGGYVAVAPVEQFKPGQSVRVLTGPFAGHVGIYQGMRQQDRELVLLSLLGSKTRVSFGVGELAAA